MKMIPDLNINTRKVDRGLTGEYDSFAELKNVNWP